MVEKVRNIDKEVEVLQALSILEFTVVSNAKERISKNAYVLCVQEKSVSQIVEAGEIGELIRAFSENAPQSEMEMEINDRNEFEEEWQQCLNGWNIVDKILEESDGDCREMDNRAIEEEEDHVDNDIAESQSGNPH